MNQLMPLQDGVMVRTIDCECLILREEYPADQYWLPFVKAIVALPPLPVFNFANFIFGGPPVMTFRRHRARVMPLRILHQIGVFQRILPFREYRSAIHDIGLEKAEFPLWDRDADGNLYGLENCTADLDQCDGRHYYNDNDVIFELESDFRNIWKASPDAQRSNYCC